MTRHATGDFETRSREDLRKGGLYKYARGASTEVLCFACKMDDEPAWVWFPSMPNYNASRLKSFLDFIREGGEFHAHNAEFELEIWNQVQVKRYNWPALKISQCRCSLARASMLGLPRSLGVLCSVLGTKAQKDTEGARLMMRLCKPQKDGTWYGGEAEIRRLGAYCLMDVETEAACEKLLPELPPEEQRLWELTVTMNQLGIMCDRDACEKAAALLYTNDSRMHAEIARLTGGRVKTGRQIKAMLAELEAEGLEVDCLDKFAVSEALKTAGLSDRAEALLTVRQEIGKSSVRKYATLIAQCCDDGRLRGGLRYHGASTGRFAGQGYQPQNFPRGTIKDVGTILRALAQNDFDFFQALYPSVGEALSSALRSMLIASPGHTFFDGDFSAIEARVLNWLAGDLGMMAAYRRGVDTYKQMAAQIFGCAVEDVDDNKRWLGKKCELGAGYQVGAKKFHTSCAQEGLAIPMSLAELAIKTYRAAHKPVVELWYRLEAAAIDAVRCRGSVQECGRVAFCMQGPYLLARLPSGRKLWYVKPYVRMEDGPFGVRPVLHYLGQFGGKPVNENIYGGKWAENITSAIARDLMVAAMFRLQDAGYDIRLTIHDEILCESKIGSGQTLEEFRRLMEIVPTWADGLPVKTGTWEGPIFRKG